MGGRRQNGMRKKLLNAYSNSNRTYGAGGCYRQKRKLKNIQVKKERAYEEKIFFIAALYLSDNLVNGRQSDT